MSVQSTPDIPERDSMRNKYIWLPTILGVYFLFMTFRFGVDLLADGQSIKFWVTVCSEIIILVLLSIVLKKRQKYRELREADINIEEKRDAKKTTDNGKQ